jgi:flagellar basal body-associated protein FliL
VMIVVVVVVVVMMVVVVVVVLLVMKTRADIENSKRPYQNTPLVWRELSIKTPSLLLRRGRWQ